MKLALNRRRKTRIAQVLFILVMMYCISSINVLLLALGAARWIPQAHLNPRVLVWFSIISFGLALLLSVYHLITFIIRQQRDGENPSLAGSMPA
ncbi:MAG: hypothetical protein LBF63_08130 [Treponema sp.]|nr:hypothetical protein [Treponema sp.]